MDLADALAATGAHRRVCGGCGHGREWHGPYATSCETRDCKCKLYTPVLRPATTVEELIARAPAPVERAPKEEEGPQPERRARRHRSEYFPAKGGHEH